MLHFDSNIVANSALHQRWWNETLMQREAFHVAEAAHAMLANQFGLQANAIGAIIPRDAWLALDEITVKELRGDDGEAYMRDLLPLSRPVDIGTMSFQYRVSSGNGNVTRSMSGQVPETMGKTEYDYRQTIVPIFSTGYGRNWREWAALRAANFDALGDDQEIHVRDLRADMADYILDGDGDIRFNGSGAYGIRNSPHSKPVNLGSAAGGANIDLATADGDDLDDFFSTDFGKMLDDNFVTAEVNIYVSPEIARNWDRSYSGAHGFKGGTIRNFLQNNRRIAKIGVTTKLTGNEFFGFVPSSTFIRPLVGMSVTTTAAMRANPTDNYNFLIMGAMGLDIRADGKGHSGVFYSVVIN